MTPEAMIDVVKDWRWRDDRLEPAPRWYRRSSRGLKPGLSMHMRDAVQRIHWNEERGILTADEYFNLLKPIDDLMARAFISAVADKEEMEVPA